MITGRVPASPGDLDHEAVQVRVALRAFREVSQRGVMRRRSAFRRGRIRRMTRGDDGAIVMVNDGSNGIIMMVD